MRMRLLFVPLLLATGLAVAEEKAPPPVKPETPATAEKPKPETPAAPEKPKSESPAAADEAQAGKEAPAAAPAKPEVRTDGDLGMSILGNQDAPKALVIVPWKSSELGATLGIAPLLDDSRQPVDRDVFLRALSYYEIRSGRR